MHPLESASEEGVAVSLRQGDLCMNLYLTKLFLIYIHQVLNIYIYIYTFQCISKD